MNDEAESSICQRLAGRSSVCFTQPCFCILRVKCELCCPISTMLPLQSCLNGASSGHCGGCHKMNLSYWGSPSWFDAAMVTWRRTLILSVDWRSGKTFYSEEMNVSESIRIDSSPPYSQFIWQSHMRLMCLFQNENFLKCTVEHILRSPEALYAESSKKPSTNMSNGFVHFIASLGLCLRH